MKKHYETHVEDTDKLISVAGPVLDYKSLYEQYRKLMEEQAQRKYGLYTPTSEGDDDDFPSIPGMIARYSASGLTNEHMKENPVWVDKTGNGHDLQMKNFIWGGMSGVGGYVDNWNSSADWAINSYWVNSHTDHKLQFITASSVVQARSNNIYNAENVYKNILNVNGLTEAVNKGSVKALRIIATDPITLKAIKTFSFETNGVIQISFDDVLQDYYVDYFLYGNNTNDIDITIEQLPLYPGALVFDGVDDYGVCDNFPILTKEKGYTVVALRQWDQDFLNTTLTGGLLSTRNYSTGEGVAFEKIESSNKGYWNLGAGGIIDFAKSPFTWQTSKQYNNVGILKGDKNHGKPLCVGCGLSGGQQCGRFAIWELVFLDHDATEEELTKIKDYFVKTYPWLFPDQAWTVTGKTNEDEDRATIANITGNGNDLVLSNFGFAEGSGYGLYAYNFNSFNLKDNVVKSTDVKKDSFRMIGTGNSSNVLILLNESDSADWKIRITGMKEGDRCLIGNANKSGEYISVNKDGTYTFQKQYAATSTNGIWYNSSQEVDVLVEQIPEYEGYLITDGVDDKITSSIFEMGNDWTVIGDWELINTGKNDNAGIVKFNSIVIYNYNPILINIKNGRNNLIPDQNTVNAICSDGRIYSKDWKEYIYNEETESTSKNLLTIGYSGNSYTKIAFKNLAIYPTILSKEDCIKAYNYLQTLKSK